MTQPSNEETLPGPIADPDATLAPSHTGLASVDARAPAGYDIEKELGRGGMGVVYLARDTRLNRLCALKMILAGDHSSTSELERFRTEAQAIARLQHPGIVQVFEIGEHDGKPFMALEFCAGGSLDAVLAKNPLPPKEAAELVRSLAEAMQVAHQANVIHRDLKPANVLLTSVSSASGPREGAVSSAAEGNNRGLTSPARQNRGLTSPARLEPKITDFGLAKKLDEQGATRTGSVMGTPSYMPPEQAQGNKDIGPTADIYSLGAILYECLTGRPPFRAATAMETLLQVLTDEPVPLRQLNPKLPRDLETITHKCLQKDPKKRYATAQDLADDLGRYLAGEPIQARPVGVVERAVKWVRRNLVLSIAATLVLLTLTAGVIVSSVYARLASDEATAARKAEGAAAEEARAARKAEDDARTEAQRANDNLRKAEWSIYAGKLLLAQAAFNENNVPLALRHLEECQWDLRGWEHAHLLRRYDSSKHFLKGHTQSVTSVAWSPDGKRILTGSYDATVKVWDAAKGREVFHLKGHTDRVSSVAWSPDGKRILSGSKDTTAKVWDAEKGQEVLALKGHTLPVTSVAWSPDGKHILTGSGEISEPGEAKVWDAEKGRQLFNLNGHAQIVRSVAWSPDGKRILTGSWDNTARVWDAVKGQEVLVLMGHTKLVTSVAWSPDGKRILTGSHDTTVKVWDAEKGQEVLHLKGHTQPVRSVSWSPNGKHLLSGSGNVLGRGKPGEAKVWDAEKGQEDLALKGHTESVSSVAWSLDGKRILTGSWDNTARVWDAEKGQEVLALKGHTDRVASVAWSPDGKCILTGSGDCTAKICDTEKGQEVFVLMGHTKLVSSVAWSPDGKRILTGSHDATVKVWDAENGRQVLHLKGHTRPVTSVAWSPDGNRILTGAGDYLGRGKPGEAKVWDAERGHEVCVLKGHGQSVNSVAWSPDGKRILTGSGEIGEPGEAKVWDAEKGQEVLTLKDASGPVAWSPDGKRILTGSEDGTAKVWDAEKGQELLALKDNTGTGSSVAWSPDGKRILTAGYLGAKVWDARVGR